MHALKERFAPQHALQEQGQAHAQGSQRQMTMHADTMTDVTGNTALSRMGTGLASTFSPYASHRRSGTYSNSNVSSSRW